MFYRGFSCKRKKCNAYTLCSFFFWGGRVGNNRFLLDQTLLDGNLGIDD